MQSFDSLRELRNGKKCEIASNTTMGKNSSSEGSPAMNSAETNENAGLEHRAFLQAEVDEWIKSFIAPLTKELKDWIQFVQGIATASHPNY